MKHFGDYLKNIIVIGGLSIQYINKRMVKFLHFEDNPYKLLKHFANMDKRKLIVYDLMDLHIF